MKNIQRTFTLIFIIVLNCYSMIYAYNLRQYSSKDGLSNSAILSMCQDEKGYVWFGSCDGLNVFDGINFYVYKPTDNFNNLSGNIIESVLDAGNSILWVQTNYCLDRFDSEKRTIRTFKEFKGNNALAKGKGNDIYVVKENNYIHYYKSATDNFEKIFVENLIFENILEMVLDDRGILWIFSSDNNHRSFEIVIDKDETRLIPRNYFKHDKSVLWCFYDDSNFYFIDSNYDLYEYNVVYNNKYFVYDLSVEIGQRGKISSIIKRENDYFIGFETSGLICLQEIKEQKKRFFIHEIDIKSGIFCLKKDRYQDIIWVGTDGQGVYMCYSDSYSLKSTLFRDLNTPLSNPVRAIYLDKEAALWVGTKGDGILKINNYNIFSGTGGNTEHILTNNSPLESNQVYVVAPSNKNILWIGSENGINYYSYKEGKIKKMKINLTDDLPVRRVHSVCESENSTLWIATVGEGFIKARIDGTVNEPELTVIKRYIFDKKKLSSNYFFTSFMENDSVLWFGNRGYGAYRINTITEKIDIFTFDENNANQTMNDVFSIFKNDAGYWFGTSYGLVNLKGEKKSIFSEQNGLSNNTIHGILQDNYDNLWLSTNNGLVKFNIENSTFQVYKQPNELEVTEFSDGALFKDERTGVLFFGGINGFVTVIKNESQEHIYIPPVRFSGLSIFGKEHNIYDFLSEDDSEPTLELKYSQDFFSLTFTAINYVNGKDYNYFYKIQELNDDWIDNGTSNSASFTNFSPGKYTLQIKYRNNITGAESQAYSLIINILPPWYRTTIAYVLYSFIILIIIYLFAVLALKWYRMKQNNIIERMDRKQREEIYESKLRFFTNITHELCTPLTLIQGPCEKILLHENSDSYIQKYATLIQHNSNKLNSLIQELIEFRRLETGNKIIEINRFPVSELVHNSVSQFTELAESRKLEYEVDIESDIVWNSDKSCLNKIITNLISNAFKYTFDNGTIAVKLFVEDENLNIVISNTGKGIKAEDIEKIFNRYTVLDNFEIQSTKDSSPRNGLGLAICNSMVKLLNGEIKVTSTLNELTTFRVILPPLDSETEEGYTNIDVIKRIQAVEPVFEPIQKEFDSEKQTVMIIDDDPSMLWFVAGIFEKKYNVIPINNPEEVMERLKLEIPDLIISDVMMPAIDGISLTKTIKSDKRLNHIPLILLSAKIDTEEQVRGIDSGAEVYITKPFNVEYLEKVTDRLIQRKKDLREYYDSALSVYELKEGKFIHVEDREFFEKVFQKIEANLSNADLSVDMLSDILGYSTRQFYRKLKNITDKTPNELIKECRLKTVERMLVSTNLSVDEILYKTGFVSRGNFFKSFSQEYGMTPKNYREQKRKESSAK